MIWKNPFITKNTEALSSEFLVLFESSVLQMISEIHFSGMTNILSTPGAGKTSLFHAFSDEILSQIIVQNEKDSNKDYLKIMKHMGMIRDNKVRLLSAYVSCARSYNIIEEMFRNGRQKMVLSALLNYRIVIAFMRSMEQLFDWNSVKDYANIGFRSVPDELRTEGEIFSNGKVLYEWVCDKEKELCKYLDGEREDLIDIPFAFTTLIMLKLFEQDNILYNGELYFEKTLIIFDDFHKLTESQREYMHESISTLKTSCGVWLGQRLEGLNNTKIVSPDSSIDRDYNNDIIIDSYWANKSQAFYNILSQIADKRVAGSPIRNVTTFNDCIVKDLEEKKYKKRIKEFIKVSKEEISDTEGGRIKYGDIIKYIADNELSEMESALWYECMLIMERRKQIGQMELPIYSPENVDDFKKFVSDNKKGAEFYVCIKCDIPFYRGMDNLQILSSYNVEQFLVFAGAIFDGCRIKSLGNSRKIKVALSSKEQEDIIKNICDELWKDMDYRYTNIKVIKRFLDNIGKLGQSARDHGRNSYAGGAYTGVSIKKSDLEQCEKKVHYKPLIDVLGSCVASRYLERRENKGEEITFYLNRWLCVHYELPLAYGGFKRCDSDKLLRMCSDEDDIFDNQMRIMWGNKV